jgi:hypothetical protein
VIPSLFIAGAPRCGTSSLVLYLDAHPQVFMAKPKEPHHFGADLELRPRLYAEREAYLKLFEGAGDVRHAGEASVLYMYSRSAPAEILALSPDARVILMLRDPLEMLPSLHTHNLLLNYEDLLDFSQALDAEADRREGRRIPRSCIPPLALQYVRLARFAEPVRFYRDAFGEERVRCILMEDLRKEPERTYAETLRFLDLPEAPTPELTAHNKGLRWRSQRLAQLLLPAYARANGVAGRSKTRIARRAGALAVNLLFYPPLRLNLRAARTPKLTRDLRARLREQLKDDVAQLADLLGRDLSGWLRVEA